MTTTTYTSNNSGGQAWYPETNPMGAERAIRKYGPLTVLAPLSVTAEQVEAGIAELVEVWNEGMQADYPEGVYPSESECVAAGFAAALAALNIEVTA